MSSSIPFFRYFIIFVFYLTQVSCSPVSYLQAHQPRDLVFQKRVYGGVATLVGTELQAPGFSLYADGTVIYYQYIDGKRKLVVSHLSKNDFLQIYTWIKTNLNRTIEDIPKNSAAPTTEFFFDNKTTILEGLGFVKGNSALDSLQEFSKTIDRMTFGKNKTFISRKIVLYVKKLSSGDPTSWAEWNIKEIDLTSVYRKDLSFYEPNSDENSLTLEGNLAERVQKTIEQTSIYQKFSFRQQIFAVGYKPVLP